MEVSQLETLIDVWLERARQRPGAAAYTFLDDRTGQPQNLTFSELKHKSDCIATYLIKRGLSGQRVQLIYPAGLDFILAFMACLRSGVIAAPVSPPANAAQTARMFKIAADFQADIVLTTSDYLKLLQSANTSADQSLKFFSTDMLPADHHSDDQSFPKISARDTAFVQYTSGSTGNPKGVMVSHENIMHNQRVIRQAFGHDEATVFAGWLPLFHDMGLIGNVLHPLFLGVRSVLMSPMRFLSRPANWLKMISDYRATTSGGPNFAYDYCVKKINPEDIADIRLDSWQVAFNGSEPVRADTLQRFYKKFQRFGFNENAFYPCYGLAEATLFVSGVEPAEKPTCVQLNRNGLSLGMVQVKGYTAYTDEYFADERQSQSLIGCGRLWSDDRVCIVNPETEEVCEPDEVGEIWVASKSVASGYWNERELSGQIFNASLAGVRGNFLRTGDLGFLDDNNELFVTGRLRDLIIVRGRNYYPQDLEATAAASHAGLGPTAAAVSHHDTGQRIILFQELRSDLQPEGLDSDAHNEIKKCINQRIWLEHELRIHEIKLLPARSIPKTSSGKVRRQYCLEQFLKNNLQASGAEDG